MVCSWLSEQNSDLSKHCIEPLILLYWTFCYSHFNMCVPANLLQACLTLCHPMDYSLPGSSVHGILQARILEWIAILFSRGFSQPRDPTQVSCIAGGFLTIWAICSLLITFLAPIYIQHTPIVLLVSALMLLSWEILSDMMPPAILITNFVDVFLLHSIF